MRSRPALNELHSYARSLLDEAGSTVTAIPQTSGSRSRGLGWRSPRIALASLGFMVFGNIGMAAAANSAVPGDLLYPVDRAYESAAGLFGIDAGGATERLEEASVLIARGEFDAAIEPIAVAAAEIDTESSETIAALAAQLANLEANTTHREDLHRATSALATTVRGMLEEGPAGHLLAWKQAIRDGVQAVANTARGEPFTPPGLDIAPGQDDKSTPPGLDIAPGQDDKSTPPGLDIAPGQDKKTVPPPEPIEPDLPPQASDSAAPPGLATEHAPPGQDDDFLPPGQDRVKTHPQVAAK